MFARATGKKAYKLAMLIAVFAVVFTIMFIVEIKAAAADITDISNATAIEIPDITYSGKPNYPVPTLYYGGERLIPASDYTLTFSDNVQVGTASVTVIGLGRFNGRCTLEFEIVPQKAIGAETPIADAISENLLLSSEGKTENQPEAEYSHQKRTETEQPAQNQQEQETEISQTYDSSEEAPSLFLQSENVNVYAAAITDISSADISITGYYSPMGDILYSVKATLNGKALGSADIEYELPKSVGEHTVTVSGKGKYSGKKQVKCTVLSADISQAAVKVSKSLLKSGYDITVMYGAYTLVKGTDYTLSTGSTSERILIKITGKGNFSGSLSYTYIKTEEEIQQDKIRTRLDEMMAGEHNRKINDYIHSYKLGDYYNTVLTAPCTCHSYCDWDGLTSGCTCLIGRSTVLGRYGIQCAGFTYEVFEYLFGGTNTAGGNLLEVYDRTNNWTVGALKRWMTRNFRPGDYLAYTNIKYGYDHYVTVHSIDTDGIWVYEANYGGRCKINFRKMTFEEFYDQTDDLWHRTPLNYKLTE